jgi:hypothetical protein
MKTLFLISSFVFIFSCKKETGKNPLKASGSSDTLTSSSVRDSTTVENKLLTIEDIKKEYQSINDKLNKKGLDSVSFDYNCNDERSGTVTFFSDQKGLRMIKHFYAEYSHFSSVENYFIKNNTLFFIFKEDTSWNFDGGTPEKPETKDDIIEHRIYLQNNTPIKCFEKKYSIRSKESIHPDVDKMANKEVSCSVDELLKTYQLLLKNKDKRGEIKSL